MDFTQNYRQLLKAEAFLIASNLQWIIQKVTDDYAAFRIAHPVGHSQDDRVHGMAIRSYFEAGPGSRVRGRLLSIVSAIESELNIDQKDKLESIIAVVQLSESFGENKGILEDYHDRLINLTAKL
ncbi:hypothetical protein [Spirosoma panaciterrae]|uniref:hypothetical protein n=1 Tax=Spirosoma panaciterrae TaxID=496058 RepID=UPI0003704607|nr:hypothetical protein [Spirosoma panaciterrae]